MKSQSILLLTLALLVTSCSEIQQDKEQSLQTEGICVTVSAPDFVFGDDTKSSLSTSGAFSWSAGDRIGIYSNQIGAVTQTSSQLALTLAAGEGTSTAYSSTTGWSLIPGSTFNYFSYYPYSGDNSREQIVIDYTGQTQSANNSAAHIGAYDYMYSDMAVASSATSASFSFHHIGCLVNVNITVPSEYENTTFYKMRLYADSDLFTSSASYSVNDVATSGTPSLVRKMCDGIQLSFGDAGIKPTDGVINAWLMTAPEQWKDKAITAKLYAAKNSVPTLAGTFTPSANQTTGIPYAYSVISSATGQTLPDKPTSGEQLHILLFGHSFGLDCTDYLPAITKVAGVTDVHYGRWYQGSCTLRQHWGHFTAKDTYTYYDSNPATGSWKSSSNRRVDDVLAQYPWDFILFQQTIGFSGEGSYSSYQPHLNYLTHYVDSVCTEIHGKTPIIGWNMFWGYNEGNYTDYDRGTRGALAMYNAIVTATQAMVADTTKANEIRLIIPAGTAIQNARGTSLNDPGSAGPPVVASTTKLLTRDGFHASYGIGRYVTACTWFQTLIAPIYGVDITGNTYRPSGYTPSFETDVITDARAAICWKCAKAAVEHPYVVSTIDETTP